MNGPKADTITGRLRDHALHAPQSVFCTFLSGAHEETISFLQLYERSLAYAARYSDLGLRRGDLVLIILRHTPHLYYSYIGAILAGAIPSFMPFPSPKQRADLYWADHKALFDRIDPALLVTYIENERSARENISGFDLPVLIASDDILGSFPQSEFEPTFSGAGDVACLQHSSGTTDLKKGVMLSHRAILDEVSSYASALAFTTEDSIASWLPLYHDMGFIACFMMSVVSGTRLVSLDPFEWVMRPRILLDAIERYRTTFCWLPNFAFGHLANVVRASQEWDLSSARAFINCSEVCKPGAFAKFLGRFGSSGVQIEKLQVCYAMAENVFGVTQTTMEVAVRQIVLDADAFAAGAIAEARHESRTVALLSCGPPIDGVSVEIRDATGLTLPERLVGEIYIKSRFLFDGYYRLPDKTAAKLRDGWYASGDLGFIWDGELFITGRVDDMLIIAGRNYYAHEIEEIVHQVSAVIPGRSVALAVEDNLTDAMAVAILAECNDGADFRAVGQQVRRDVLGKLGLAVHAVLLFPRGTLIKTTSGKISRLKNLSLYYEQVKQVRR